MDNRPMASLFALILVSTAIAAGSSPAQERTDADAHFDAVLYCLTTGARVSMMEDATRGQWRHDVDAATGLHVFTPDDTEQVFVRMEEDNLEDSEHVCDAVALGVPTADAQRLLDDMISTNGFPYTPGAEDELGCPAWRNEFGWTASVRSGGDDGTCDDPAQSTIRVTRVYDN